MAISEVTIALPFSISSFGGVSASTSQERIWADRARSVIGTSLQERVMRPQFGTDIPRTLFDTEEVMRLKIEEEISKAFTSYLPLLTLDSITTEFDSATNIITATVLYELPNQEEASLSIGIATISPNSPISEVLQ
jgi:phage baseplate assembly protein W